MPRLGSIFAALGAGSRSLQEDNARQKAEQIALEDRLARQQEAERRRTLEEALEGRRVEEHKAQANSRTLEDALTQARTADIQKPDVVKPQAPVRGTPEYLETIKDEATVRAEIEQGKPAGADRKPAEFEKKAAFVLEGAESAAKALDGYKAPARSAIRHVPGLGNYGMTPEDQVANQAAETLADAYLRLTTGATITPEEVKNTARQMVPTPGDAEPVLAAKKARREQVIRAIREAASVAKPEAPVVPRSSGKKLSAEDAAKAKADPGFAAWLKSQGFEVP
jgi:hypothetical protein